MTNKELYLKRKKKLVEDNSICKENKVVFKEYFEEEEYKLKKINHLQELDEKTYKTLLEYTSRLRTVNRWFNNKPWKDLTEEEIKQTTDDVDSGVIKTDSGKTYTGQITYYKKILKGRPFEMVGKSEISRKVLRYTTQIKKEPKYFLKEDFDKLLEVITKPTFKLLLWLCFDYGENINTILELRKRDFTKRKNTYTRDYEYLLNLQKDILKRSRRPRGLTNNYPDTVLFLDIELGKIEDDDKLFNFGYSSFRKVWSRLVKETNIKVKPIGETPTIKDLRSSMACDLLTKEWTCEEINHRLGHSPNSQEINKYVNLLALGDTEFRTKKKFVRSENLKLKEDIEKNNDTIKRLEIKLHNQNVIIKEIEQRLGKLV